MKHIITIVGATPYVNLETPEVPHAISRGVTPESLPHCVNDLLVQYKDICHINNTSIRYISFS